MRLKRIVTPILVALAVTSCATTTNETSDSMSLAKSAVVHVSAPKNIIMVVSDGMGPVYPTAYRYYQDDPNTQEIEETVFDRHLVGAASTYPAQVSNRVTDSAAGATALSCGIKTYNGAIGVDENKQPCETVLEYAKKQGLKTGAVVTSQINHATPAGYLAHNESRRNYNEIADSYLDDGIKADVLFGGGWKYFIREDRNLVEEFQNNGFHYIDNYQDLATLPKDKPVLGLFDNVGLPWAIDDTNSQRLSTMTKAAISQLSNDNGFFMLVEASQVDWAGHANDINAAMAEMHDLAVTMEYLEQYVAQNPDTLVILTADHSTGGLTLGVDGKYEWNPELLRNIKHSSQYIASTLVKQDITATLTEQLMSFSLTEEELQSLQMAKQQSAEALFAYNQLSKDEKKQQRKPSLERPVFKAINKIIDQRTTTGWTTGGHTGIDVPVYAFGSNKEIFAGKLDNTDIAKKIFKLLGKS